MSNDTSNFKVKQLKDLTGMRFGKLEVISFFKKEKRRNFWKCLCDCGNSANIRGDHLISGNSTTCGRCYKNKILIGNKYNQLTVLSLSENKGYRNATMYVCQCDCGKVKEISEYGLITGRTKTCGDDSFHQRDDLTGKRFGKLVVIAFVNNTNKTSWECLCDCGNKTTVRADVLKNGHAKSCGCYLKESAIKRLGLPSEEAALRRVYIIYKDNAVQRGYEYLLSYEETAALLIQPCHYCGVEPKEKTPRKGKNGTAKYGGIDRVDNTKGYVINNCVPCCESCNRRKRTDTLDDFLSWVKRVYEYNFLKS